VLGTYLVIVLAVGIHFRKRQRDSGTYFLGNRKIPGWAVGISMFASMTSSWAFLALPAKAFATDLSYLMAVAALPIAALLGSRYFVPFFREKIGLTAYEFLEARFGAGPRLYGNVTFMVVHMGKMAAVLYLLSLALSEMTGYSLFAIIVFLGSCTVIYSMVGGLEGVVWTDVIEGCLLLFAGVVSIGFILATAPGGPGAVMEAAQSGRKLVLIAPGFDWQRAGSLALFVFGLNYYTQKYIGDQTVVQRYLLAASAGKAGRALWLSSFLIMGVWILFMSIGALLWSYYHLQPELLPDAVRAKPDKVFSHFIGHQLPAGVTGLILAGLLAASMGSLASDLNSFSAVLYNDFYRRWRKAGNAERHLCFSRLAVAGTGAVAVGLAMLMTGIHSMADAAINFVSVVGGGILSMFLLGIFSRRAHLRGLVVGLTAGVIVSLWAYLCGPGSTFAPGLPRFPLHGVWIGFVGNGVVFGVGYLAGVLWPNRAVVRTSEASSLV
jgi:SSS family solute:Na+ symporter